MLSHLKILPLIGLLLCSDVFAASGGAAYPFTSILPYGSDTAVACYSFRKLVGSYTGKSMNIIRASDSTTKDIGFGNYNFDLTTAANFCAGTTCKVKTWYNQCNAGVADVTQATGSKQPALTFACQGNLPCATFASASSQVLTGTLGAGITDDTWVVVGSYTNNAASHTFASTGDHTNGTELRYTTTSSNCAASRVVSGGINSGTEACTISTTYSFISTIRYASTALSRIFVNNVVGTDGTSALGTPAATTTVSLGAALAANFHTGNVEEAILFAPNIADADAQAVSTNQQTYWGIR